ncbi:uncharacterized protein LOC135814834 isoform X1 [Sycon ciliatum]|uniref:uncharacterized protein LOC135814834 isoform X1 n=1 Tax=Sycon ciliatum TaxID=27933 RepID=UPI0031F684AE
MTLVQASHIVALAMLLTARAQAVEDVNATTTAMTDPTTTEPAPEPEYTGLSPDLCPPPHSRSALCTNVVPVLIGHNASLDCRQELLTHSGRKHTLNLAKFVFTGSKPVPNQGGDPTTSIFLHDRSLQMLFSTINGSATDVDLTVAVRNVSYRDQGFYSCLFHIGGRGLHQSLFLFPFSMDTVHVCYRITTGFPDGSIGIHSQCNHEPLALGKGTRPTWIFMRADLLSPPLVNECEEFVHVRFKTPKTVLAREDGFHCANISIPNNSRRFSVTIVVKLRLAGEKSFLKHSRFPITF